MRLAVSSTGLYRYPDAMVTCGEPEAYNGRNDTLTNPVVIFEVLSEGTDNYDGGEKFEQYRRLPSLQEYVILAQDRFLIEHHASYMTGSVLQLASGRFFETIVSKASTLSAETTPF